MAIQVRRGNETDFDPTKMLPGEWAVSLDTKYVRMCFSPGICLRMATYEAFEADMAEIQSIMAEARTIEEAVARIQMEINDTAVVVENYAILSKSYAVGGTGTRAGEDVDNAKYYYEQAKKISQGMSGLIPMGTITFADLSNTDNQVAKYMFNISDAFTTDDTFKEGAGYHYGEGTNVFRTEDGYWDAMAGSTVSGVKGANESTYRQGNVSLSAEDVGAVATGADTADNTVAFTNRDIASPTTWLETDVLQSGEKHSSLLEKISAMFRNVRYLFARVGSEDVSELGDTLSSAILKAAEQGGGTASDVTYDNTTSELESTDAQGAIDEIKGMVDETNNNLSSMLATTVEYITNETGVTISANGVYNGNYTLEKEGYIPLGAISFNTNNSALYFVGIYVTGYTVAFYLKNTTSADTTCKNAYIKVLWIKVS